MKCNRDCFHCEYEDCIVDGVSVTERIDQMERDINTQTQSKSVLYGGKASGKHKFGRVWSG